MPIDVSPAAENDQSCAAGYLPLQYERYVPTPFYVGSDSIAVSATDGTYTSTQVQIPITVNFVEIPPTLPGRLSGDAEHRRDLGPRLAIAPSGANRGKFGLIEQVADQADIDEGFQRRLAGERGRTVLAPVGQALPRKLAVAPGIRAHDCQGSLTTVRGRA